jgi:MFS transporter, Spinster family, sphingosine-1-phosphate transporter
MLVGLPGVLMSVVVWRMIPDRNRPVREVTAAQREQSMFSSIGELIKFRSYMILVLAASFCSFLSYGKATWNTIYFQRSHELSPGEVGFWFGLFGGLAAALGTWLGGWLANRYGSIDRRHVATAPAIGMVLAAPLALLGYSTNDWRLALVLLMVPAVMNSLYYGPTFSSVQGLVPLHQRAMASALLLFSQNMIGLALGPLLFGALSDALKPAYGGESVRYVLYGAALFGLVPALLFWLLRPRLHAELDKHG